MAVEHAAEAGHGGIPELPNVITVLHERVHGQPIVQWLHHWENLVFSGAVALVICLIAWRHARTPSMIPRGGQNFLELLVEGIDRFVQSVIGHAGREHTPFVGTLFLYIWLINLSGLIPGMKSSTASLNTTLGLALAVFGYVQWVRLKTLGPINYLDHMAGFPRFKNPWLLPIMIPVHILLFVLELVGELIKPLSLSLRLGFNVFAEDVLLAVLVGLGITAGLALHLPIGLPLQCLVVPLVVIFSTVQALVFSLLSTVYIALMLPHEAHGGSGPHH